MARSRRKASQRPKTRPRPAAPERARHVPRRPKAAPAVPELAFALGFAAVCGLLALAFFREFVFRAGTMPFGTDMIEEAYPLRNFAVEEVKAGRPFPAWNPYAYSGIPFLETLPYPVFYPTSLLYFVIPLGRAIGWGFVIHFFAAGVLMFAFARRLGVSRWGAALAGLAFMFNGYLVSHLYAGQDGRMFAMTLMPLVFFFLRIGLDTRRLWPYLLMGGAVALQVFTPHVQVMYFSSLAAVAYFAVEAVWLWRREGARRALAQAGRFAAGFVLAGLVAAVQLWPTATFLKWAVRGVESGYAFASSWAMPPGEVSALIAPDLFGSLSTYWGSNPFKLHTEYLGAVPLVLAFAALLWGERRRTLVWGLLGLAALLFALGGVTPVHRLAYWLVPLIKSFRAPSMMIAVTAFAVAVLAGMGFDAMAARAGRGESARREARSLLFHGAAGLLVLLWLLAVAGALNGLVGGGPEAAQEGARAAAKSAALRAFPVSFGITVLAWVGAAALLWWGMGRGKVAPGAAAALLALLLVVDLWRVDARYLEIVDVESTFAPGPADRFLATQEPPFRIFPLPGTMGTNESILHRLEAVWGLQKFRLAWYDKLMGGSEAANLAKLPLWRLLNLRYVVSPAQLDMAGLEQVFKGPSLVYRWQGDAPRAWVAAEGRVVDDGEALRRLLDPDFPIRRLALLSEPLPLFPGAETGAGAGHSGREGGAQTFSNRGQPAHMAGVAADPPASVTAAGPQGADTKGAGARAAVRYLSFTPNRLEAEVTAEAPSYVVFSEVYHPYWEAAVDGRPARVARADLAFRAVAVPAGTHRVVMEYRPHSYERARILSLLAIAAGLAYAAVLSWRAWRGRAPGGSGRAPGDGRAAGGKRSDGEGGR